VCYPELATCPILADPDNGVVDCSVEDGEVPTEGDTCIYICDEGYELNGDITTKCTSDGTWSGMDIFLTCLRGIYNPIHYCIITDIFTVSCPELSPPNNGMVDCTGSRFEDTCNFACSDGFVISGSETRICLSNKTWSGVETVCRPGTVGIV